MPRVITPDGRAVEMGDGQSVAAPIACPELPKAVHAENLSRDLAFLALGDDSGLFTETIAGVEVQPLTTRHLLWLQTVDSCFVTGSPFHSDNAFSELVKLLRIIGVPPKRKWWQRKLSPNELNRRIIKKAFTGNMEKDCAAVRAYFDEAFADQLGGVEGGDRKKYYSFAASIVYFLGSTFGMPMDKAMDVPLKVVWQLMRVHLRSKAPDAVLFNPSDALLSRAALAAVKN